MAFEIFGFKIERNSQETANANVPAFTLPESDDGSQMVSGAGAAGYSLDMDGQYKNEVELILNIVICLKCLIVRLQLIML